MGENIDARFGKGLGDEGWKSLNRRPLHAGVELVVGDKEYLSVYTHAALTKGMPYMIDYGTTAGQELVTAAPADTGTLFLRIGVPWRDEPKNVLTWIQVRGPCSGYVNGDTDITAGAYLKVAAAADNFVIDHATRTADGCAKMAAAYTTDADVLRDIVLLGVYSQVS